MQTQFKVEEYVLPKDHPFYAKDGVWYRVREITPFHNWLWLGAFSNPKAAGEAIIRKQEKISC